MHIAYTINGEGMGHATRSSVVIRHLREQGHRVSLFSDGERPLRYLREQFGEVMQIPGFHMVYEENKVKRLRTAIRVLGGTRALRGGIAAMKEALASNPPDLVITDFEFHGGIIARLFDVPLISIDNIQTLTQAKLQVSAADMIDYELNYLVAKMMVPRADYYFIASFVPLVSRKKRGNVMFIPPLLRPAVVERSPKEGTHIVVYQTADSYDGLMELLAASPEEYRVYNCTARVQSANLAYRQFSEQQFIEDLASAKAVITSGGFTVIAESLYYHKPVLAIPIENFYEQKCNAMLLEHAGYGMMAERLTGTQLSAFIEKIPAMRERTTAIRFDTASVFEQLDALLKHIASMQDR